MAVYARVYDAGVRRVFQFTLECAALFHCGHQRGLETGILFENVCHIFCIHMPSLARD